MPKPPAASDDSNFSAARRRALSLAAAALGARALPGFAAARGDDATGETGPVVGVWTHAYAAFGRPKYPRDYANFEYVNPAAPKGGTLYLRNPDRRSS
ncbi:MAG TPA: ABC transporter substrate-binding protein, partial [Burkholderiaceae bacterium]|nr:ABC transporter substrate-binding protein [Burkholderiaceae bacterium]